MHYEITNARETDWPPLILLHGSGGSELDMLPVASAASPGAGAVALRGALPWEGGYAFFRRFPDRSLDEDSLRCEAKAIAVFVRRLLADRDVKDKPILVGFSNGAIMAAALIMMFPDLAQGAALLRPLPPFKAPVSSSAAAMPVLVLDAANDDRRRPEDGVELAAQLALADATVSHHISASDHRLLDEDLVILRG